MFLQNQWKWCFHSDSSSSSLQLVSLVEVRLLLPKTPARHVRLWHDGTCSCVLPPAQEELKMDLNLVLVSYPSAAFIWRAFGVVWGCFSRKRLKFSAFDSTHVPNSVALQITTCVSFLSLRSLSTPRSSTSSTASLRRPVWLKCFWARSLQ